MIQVIKNKFEALFNNNINFLLDTIHNKELYSGSILKLKTNMNIQQEEEKQIRIIDIFKDLLYIIHELEVYTNTINYLCHECYVIVEKIYKFIDYLMEASKLIYRYWHLGQLYCVENSRKYIKYREQIIIYVDYIK